MVEKTIFDRFTRKYQLYKTLRFELKPIWNTQKMLAENHVFETDGIRRKKYEETKPWIDRLHREFIKDALSEFSFKNLEPYRRAFEAWQKDKKSKPAKDALAKEENKLREEIVAQFSAAAQKWAEKYPDLKLKKVDIGVLFEAGVFRALKERYKNESRKTIVTDDGEEENIFDGWNGWTGYFKKFFQTRRNFYSDKDESTAVAYRIVNQNLRRFIQNIQLFKQATHKIDIAKIEKDLGVSCSKVFSFENYSNCLLQDGIDKYNRVLGGYVGENGEKIPGINQAINEYRQKNKDNKIRFLVMLDKQIHSEKEKFLDAIEKDEELVAHLSSFTKAADVKLGIFRKLIADFASNGNEYDLNKVYISSDAFERNASRWLADYSTFEQALLNTAKDYKDSYGVLDQKPPQEKDGQMKYPDFLICAHIKSALDKVSGSIFQGKYYETISSLENLPLFEQFVRIILYEVERQFSRGDVHKKAIGYEAYRNDIEPILNSTEPKIDKNAKIAIKNFADSALAIYQMAKYFAVEKKRRWLDYFELDDHFYNAADSGYMLFYGDVGNLKSAYEEIVKGYNALRNYLTKKPYSTDKWLLNFDIQTLADGWDKNKEKENGAVIFRKDGRYYLGIMHRDHKNIFTEKYQKEFMGGDYQKMVYRQIADASKDIHNLVLQSNEKALRFTKMEKKIKGWPKNIGRIKVKKSYAKENFNRDDFETFVNYMKKCAIGYWPEFAFSFSPTSSYKTIKDFTDEIEMAGYKVSFVESVSEKYLREKNTRGELFIFEIYNKDWGVGPKDESKERTKNLHTLYWEHLFSNENEKQNFVFKLNGEAELFFRPKTEEKKLGYKKWDAKEKKWMKVDKKKDGVVVDRKRYSENTVLFNCPITINRVSENKTGAQMNADIRKAIADDKEIRVMGIDRGEKHLAYYSVIDQNEKIIEQGSLNTIGKKADGRPVPYAEILVQRAKGREAARREWQDVESIKDLKKGYVSQVVRKIADLTVQSPNTIIVLEDLSIRFKQVRGGIEKSIYQQFEKQLIDKLSFLVDKKESDSTKAGHPLHAYQLASPVDSFKDMGKQTGIIFYTAASYTSRTCPVCGFRRNVRLQFENMKKASEMLDNLEEFIYDSANGSFTLVYSLKKFLSKEQKKESKAPNKLYENLPQKDKFTLTTKNAVRYKWFQHSSPRLRAIEAEKGVDDYEGSDEKETKWGKTKKFDLTVFLKTILEKKDISLIDGGLKNNIKQKRDKELYEKLFFALYLLTETRQTISGSDVDYIQCPECGFDSRKGFQRKEFDGDANGAYNIARKGIMTLEKIRQFKKANGNDLSKMEWGDLSIGIGEWDKFTQGKWNPTSKSRK